MACERREGPGDTLAVLLVAARALRVDRAARRQPGGLFTGSGGLAVLRLTGRIPLRHGGREGIDHAALGDKLDGVVDVELHAAILELPEAGKLLRGAFQVLFVLPRVRPGELTRWPCRDQEEDDEDAQDHADRYRREGRSEERRVGKERRSRWGREQYRGDGET